MWPIEKWSVAFIVGCLVVLGAGTLWSASDARGISIAIAFPPGLLLIAALISPKRSLVELIRQVPTFHKIMGSLILGVVFLLGLVKGGPVASVAVVIIAISFFALVFALSWNLRNRLLAPLTDKLSYKWRAWRSGKTDNDAGK
jgi:hypothetical protein